MTIINPECRVMLVMKANMKKDEKEHPHEINRCRWCDRLVLLSLEPGRWSKRATITPVERICNRGHLHNLPVDSAIKLANHRRASRQSDDTTRGMGRDKKREKHDTTRHDTTQDAIIATTIRAKSPQRRLDLDRRAAGGG
jgi:hypothetical protein